MKRRVEIRWRRKKKNVQKRKECFSNVKRTTEQRTHDGIATFDFFFTLQYLHLIIKEFGKQERCEKTINQTFYIN